MYVCMYVKEWKDTHENTYSALFPCSQMQVISSLLIM